MSKVGLPRWLCSTESACQAGDSGLITGSGRSPGEGNGNRLQYSFLENPMDRGAWKATVRFSESGGGGVGLGILATLFQDSKRTEKGDRVFPKTHSSYFTVFLEEEMATHSSILA